MKQLACTNKYQERDKIWLVGVYTAQQKKIFVLNLQQNHKF